MLEFTRTYGETKSVFSKDVVFNEDEIDTLYELYNSLEKKRVKRFYNLFYVNKAELHGGTLNDTQYKVWNRLRDRIDKHAGLHNYSHYFLEYNTGSFCRKHVDDEESVGKTGVTLVHASDDLLGGDSILYLPHYKDPNFSFDENWYEEGDDKEGAEIVPVVAYQNEGDTLWYDHKQNHAVSRVESGTRIVLISWYKG